MEQLYPDLLSPINVNGIILRNRIIVPPSFTGLSQGAENYPTEATIIHLANNARGGAALVVCRGRSAAPNFGHPHRNRLDTFEPYAQHYFAQMADAVRSNGAKATIQLPGPYELTAGYDVCEDSLSEYVPGDGSEPVYGKTAPKELLERVIESYTEEARIAKMLGFDGCYIHMAYRMMFPGRFISPYSNRRTDEYGGSFENRIRFPLEICQSIKDACGKDFLIEVTVSGEEPEYNPGVKIEDTIRFAILAQGKIDLMQIRGSEIDTSQPSNVNPMEIPTYDVTKKITKAVHSANCSTKIVLVGGAHNAQTAQNAIADEACDIVASARGFITNPNFIKMAEKNCAAEDYLPCLRCNKCHQARPNFWMMVCSVNPLYGIEHRAEQLTTPPSGKKKVAVIGGGPAGMEAAIISADRGYDVTLYEKADKLGGQLNAASVPYLKWPMVRYLKYLIRQVEKRNIKVMLNFEVKPGALKNEGYDSVLIAIGASPMRPLIPGADSPLVLTAFDALLNTDKVTGEVIIIGGGEVGVETGLHFAKNGHKVMVLEMLDRLASESAPTHYRSKFVEEWENEPNFSYELKARCTGVADGKSVSYISDSGEKKVIHADTVIVSTGMRANGAEAFALFGQAPATFLIGDCRKADSIQASVRNAYFTASNL